MQQVLPALSVHMKPQSYFRVSQVRSGVYPCMMEFSFLLLGASICAIFIWCFEWFVVLPKSFSTASEANTWNRHLLEPTEAVDTPLFDWSPQSPSRLVTVSQGDIHPFFHGLWSLNQHGIHHWMISILQLPAVMSAISAMPEPIHSCYPSCWCWRN